MMQHQKIETTITCVNSTNSFEKQKGERSPSAFCEFYLQRKRTSNREEKNRTSFISNTVESHTTA
jgi:hypothetical protein